VSRRVRIAAFCLPPAGAALLVVALEVARSALFGAVEWGGVGPGLVFALCVAGVLGLPLFALGVTLRSVVAGTRQGWRWGFAGTPPVDRTYRAAWVVFGAACLAAAVLAVQVSVVQFSAVMRKPVYQGLAAGLVGVSVQLVLLALAGPMVGGLARGLSALRRVLPAPLDPTALRGAATVGGVFVLLAGATLPLVMPELHTIDRRPLWLALAFAFGLVGMTFGAPTLATRWPRAVILTAALGLALPGVGLGVAFGWAGARQSRLLGLDRDTLLTGVILKRLRTLTDADGDGVSARFGGGDCDDTDAAVRPGGYDVPDNRRDENCNGADLSLRADPLKAPVRTPPSGPSQPWHVVFLTIDTVRDDLARQYMPNLMALAAESMDFRRAYAHGAATYWSIPALMAGTMQSRLEFGPDQTPVEKEVLLAEVLRDAGWQTALYANVTIFFVRGLKQGTEYQNYETSDFTKHGEFPGAEHLTRGLLAYVDRHQQDTRPTRKDRFFLWGHYYDPHDPYGEVPGHPAADDSDRARYIANLSYTDEHVGALIAGLKARGVWERTVLVVTSDHGDEFGEHGHRFHGGTLYEEMIRVPLLIRVPGLPGRVSDVPIAHVDVAPTLLELLGVAVPSRYVGRSRADEMRTGQPPAPYPVYAEVLPDSNYDRHQIAVILGQHKLIQRFGEGYGELYDLASDPAERENRIDDDPVMATLGPMAATYADHHLHWVAQGKTGARIPPGKRSAGGAPVKR
jgi:choline-sulfatase